MQHNILDDSPGPEDEANFSLGGRVGLKSVH